MKKWLLIIFLSIIQHQAAMGQSLISGISEEDFDSLLADISNSLYNLEFDETNNKIQELEERIPDHPVVDLLRAVNILWQNIPNATTENYKLMPFYLQKAIDKADSQLVENPKNPEMKFFKLMGYSLLAQYYNDQDLVFKTFSVAKKAYAQIVDGFELMDDYNEYLFSTGIYNYYRVRYPQVYPIYKPLVFFFKGGDIDLGLEQLQKATVETVITQVEAVNYLSYIYLRYESKFGEAEKILRPVVLKYPRNLYFKSMYLEAAVHSGGLNQNKSFIDQLVSSEIDFYKLCGLTFSGILAEKYDRNQELAIRRYQSSIEFSKSFEQKKLHPVAVAYAGMARIEFRNGDIQEAKSHYKMALKHSKSQAINQEAEQFIKNN